MQITENQTAAAGGRVSSPKLRASLQKADEYSGLAEDTDRFNILKLVKKAGKKAGFTPELTQLLEYYVIRTSEIDWTEGNQPICYQAVTTTAHDLGISERQVRNREKALHELGALRWEDSGNFKRFGVRDRETGKILYAFGVDMSPLAALMPHLKEKVQEKAEYKVAWNEAKRKISGYRGRIRSLMAEVGLHEELADIFITFQEQYEELSYKIKTRHSLDVLKALSAKHQHLYRALSETLERIAPATGNIENTDDISVRDEEDFRHIQSTNTEESDKSDYSSRSDTAYQGSVTEKTIETGNGSACGENREGEEQATIQTGAEKISLKQAIGASTERFKERLPLSEKDVSWDDLVEAAYRLLNEVGINQSAWGEACRVLGRNSAAICVMVIDQKAQDPENPVRNPGGYLRAMTAKAKKGELNLQGSVWGFLKRGKESYDA